MRSNARPSVERATMPPRPTIQKAVGGRCRARGPLRVDAGGHRRPRLAAVDRLLDGAAAQAPANQRIRRADLVAPERRRLDDLAHAALVARGGCRRGRRLRWRRRGSGGDFVGRPGRGGGRRGRTGLRVLLPLLRLELAGLIDVFRVDLRRLGLLLFDRRRFRSRVLRVRQLRLIRRGDRRGRLRDLRRLSRQHDHDHEDGGGRGHRDHPHPPRPARGGLHDFRRRRRGRGLGKSALGSHEGGHQRLTPRAVGDVRSRALERRAEQLAVEPGRGGFGVQAGVGRLRLLARAERPAEQGVGRLVAPGCVGHGAFSS